jgi:nitrite reductase (NADH) large subunit
LPLVDKALEEGAVDYDFSKYVILGNGPAGISALLAIREVDPDGGVVIVSPEVERYYSKILLTYWIGKKVKFDEVFLVEEDFYEKNRARCVLGVGATRVDTVRREVELQDGRRLRYDSLLLATGGSPQVPDIPGVDIPGVYCLRTIEDGKKIQDATSYSKRAVVIGGGLVSIKTVEALLARDIEVLLVVSSGRLLSQITAPEDSEMTLSMFQAPGLDIRLNCDALAIEGDRRVESVRLSTGDVIGCDMVVVGKGVSPNLSCIQGTGIETGAGILVNDRMETSVRHVYAAGDIA